MVSKTLIILIIGTTLTATLLIGTAHFQWGLFSVQEFSAFGPMTTRQLQLGGLVVDKSYDPNSRSGDYECVIFTYRSEQPTCSFSSLPVFIPSDIDVNDITAVRLKYTVMNPSGNLIVYYNSKCMLAHTEQRSGGLVEFYDCDVHGGINGLFSGTIFTTIFEPIMTIDLPIVSQRNFTIDFAGLDRTSSATLQNIVLEIDYIPSTTTTTQSQTTTTMTSGTTTTTFDGGGGGGGGTIPFEWMVALLLIALVLIIFVVGLMLWRKNR